MIYDFLVSDKLKHRHFLYLAILVFCITAINSHGFHHYDEHFQILEFSGLKLGFNSEKDLAWEYHEKIRSSVQPYTAEVLIRICNFFDIDSPFLQAQVIRVCTALFMLFCIYMFVESTVDMIPQNYRNLYYIMSYFLCFIPYIAVRFSSETMGAGFFLIGLALTLNELKFKNKIRWFYWILIGLMLGLSYIHRFQIAFFIIGLIVWLIFIQKIAFKKVALLGVSIILMIGIGIILDSYFYGEFNFSSWNYFKSNIVNDKASSFGVSPWYFYFTDLLSLKYLSYLAITLLVLIVIFLIKEPGSYLFFILVPFIAIHSLIGHKELRFIFPCMFFIPLAVVQGWIYIKPIFNNLILKIIAYIFITSLIISNVVALIVFSIIPANGQPIVYKIIEEHYSKPPVFYLEDKWADFFESQALLKMNFYQRNVEGLYKVSLNDVNTLPDGALVLTRVNTSIDGLPLKEEYKALPLWIIKINKDNWMQINNADWIIYKKIKSIN
jgi:phosphatidylinositol glycan class B